MVTVRHAHLYLLDEPQSNGYYEQYTKQIFYFSTTFSTIQNRAQLRKGRCPDSPDPFPSSCAPGALN